MQTTVQSTLNGVNVEQLTETIANIKHDPSLGVSKFRVTNKWVSGGHNRSQAQGFYAAGREDDTRERPHVMDADEPVILAVIDKGANPVEHLLHALASCVTTSMVYHAAARGIKIEELESQLEGDLDIRGFMGIAPDVRKGYQNIRVNFRVKSDATAALLASFTPALLAKAFRGEL